MDILDANRRHIDRLRKAWRDGQLVLFLGGGISIPHGIPDWSDLVLELLFEMRSEDFADTWPHYRFALGRWFVDTFDFSPTVLARLLSGDDGFINEVRQILYRNYTAESQNYSALDDIARLIEHSVDGQRQHIPAVITFNYDNLLEEKLTERGVAHEPIFAGKRISDELPIIHVHGFLPHEGEPSTEIVMSEDEFHQLSFSTVEWVNSELAHYLHNHTGLFLGLSMTDPNLRRLLDATCIPADEPRHVLLRKEHDVDDREAAAAEIQRRADEAARHRELDQPEGREAVAGALDGIVDRVHDYEERLFEDLGLNTIWLDRYEDITAILEAIRNEA